MRVYVVTWAEWDAFVVEGVFASQEAAESYIKVQPRHLRTLMHVEEHEVRS